ncbi:inositol monophosphatase [Xylanibacillus composti]|uniref:Inositol-1-monophosphatase n=1 Tax=Xylanibacillus composti TaxID=1572762 RepID=A0A8J4H5Q5_9BACL|nr:inositol monophosphatase family protein [Xylanibacillus composti]MDT9725871.1 inositol monophosphatase [Xylanibacillus composti]GIQ69173.1 inositol monophosphatase [Xylanibacillus composti]
MGTSDGKTPYVVGSKNHTAVAISAASKSGEWIKSRMGQFQELNLKSSPTDLVTEVDKGSETMIRNLIQTHFPQHDFLGEEGVEPGAEASAKALGECKDSEFLWIVDPIDGTTNFIHGFPFYCVSIALAVRGEVQLGVVYNPFHDEMFVAERGKGAYLRGKRTAVSEELRLSDSLIATGFPADRGKNLTANMRGLNRIVNKARNVRTAGSAALHLAYVAAGRLSGFWEYGLNAWDLAAGSLIVQESGGRITDLNGNPYTLEVRDVLASNGRIHDELLTELEQA